MKRFYIIILTTLMINFVCCKRDKFPKVRKLTSYKQTEFLPTLEHNISMDKNAIYSGTLLYAWSEIKQRIQQPLIINNSLKDLIFLNNSKTFLNSLTKNEYEAIGEVNGNYIHAKAIFSKSLPFEHKLTSFTNKLIFDGKRVSSFGQISFNYETSNIIQILFYKNDNNFIIKLSPKDKNHEIILYKSSVSQKNMSEIIQVITNKIEEGKKDKLLDQTDWRYYLRDEDSVIIPKLKFNIENNYSSMEGEMIKSGNQDYILESVYQRTAFILDEEGAKIESKSEIIVSSDLEDLKSIPHPKIMRFDKPFFLMLKRKDNNYPYFALWINNTELMKKEE